MAETQTDALSGIDTNAFQSAMKLGLRPGSKEFWAHFGLLRRMSPDYAHLKTDQELDWTDYFLDELSGGKHLKEYNDLGAQQRKVLDLYSAMQAHTAQKQAESQVGAVPIPYSEGQAEVPPQAGAVLNAPQFQAGVERAMTPSRLQAETALAPESAMVGLPDKGGRVPLQTAELQATPPMIQPPGTNVWDVPALETRPPLAGRPAVPPMAAGFPVTPQGLELIKGAGAVQPQHLKEVLEMARGPQPEKPEFGTVTEGGYIYDKRTGQVLDQAGQKAGKTPDFGNMREAKAYELYNKPFVDLTQPERAEVQKQAKADQARERAEAAALVGIAVDSAKQTYRLGEKHDNWINLDTLTPAKPNQTLDDVSQGYVHIDEQRKPAIAQIRTLVSGLKTIEEAGSRLLRSRTGFTLWDAPAGVAQSMMLSAKEIAGDPDAQLLNSVITRLTVPQAKLQGDAANVSNAEREMLAKSTLDKNDSVESMRAKVKDIKAAIESILVGMGFPEGVMTKLEGRTGGKGDGSAQSINELIKKARPKQ